MITKLEIPLCPYDSCRLLSVNLYSYVENPFTDKAYFNYDKFKDVVYKAQRLMDDVVDLEEEKINLILKKIENDPEPEEIKAIERNLWIKIKIKLLDGRRTGLSAIGLADCLAALNKGYATDESIKLTEEIYKQFAISAYKSSIDMAVERGAFPIHDYMKEFQNPFLKRILKELENLGEEEYDLAGLSHSRRNISLLTIPPNGTISLLANLSSGIEPVYQLYYKRRRKLETGNPKITFVDQNGDGWEEYVVLHPKFKEWYYSNPVKRKLILEHPDNLKYFDSIINDPENPYLHSTSYEIDPLQRVKLQATIQKWIDHSISSTINLPKGTTEETVSNLYMEAWKQGCKGLTVYVDECRTGVLVSNNDKSKEEFKQHDAPKRPKELEAEFHQVKVKGTNYGIFIGLLNSKPYEVFAFSEPNTDKKFIRGIIRKSGRGEYEFNSDTYHVINLIPLNETAEERTFTLMLSGLLRHGAHPKFIIDWISKAELEITSFGVSIARILKKYISDNTESKELCPNCQSKIIYINGCKECSRENDPDCTYSKCG